MKNVLLVVSLFSSLTVLCQFSSNNFEENFNLNIEIGDSPSDSLWQIGPPQKSVFDLASSEPNVIVTDTIGTYPINSSASFIVEVNEKIMFGFPYIQLEWFHKTDLEKSVDGGIIEVSYDTGSTWSNIFTDSTYRPEVVGGYTWDTLSNGQAGITGVKDWAWMAICWGTSIGEQPPIDPTILIRFTMYSDSTDTNQDGWMLDDFYLLGGVIGNTSSSSNHKPIAVYPNPSNDRFYINENFSEDEIGELKVLDFRGASIFSKQLNLSNLQDFEIDLSHFSAGIYYLLIETEEATYSQKLIKTIGN